MALDPLQSVDLASPGPGPVSTPDPHAEDRAYRAFFRRYERPILVLAHRRGLHAEDAEDVVQAVMLAAWRRLDGTVVQGDAARFGGLVRRVAGHKTIDLLRRQRVRRAAETQRGTGGERATTGACGATGERVTAGEPVDSAPDPAEAYDRAVELAELAAGLEHVRGEVAPRTFDAFRRYVLEERPAAETAAATGMPVNQVYVIRHQVVERLRRLLTPRP
jgi:RNA polymerase sigma factor (sigma-70 family)